MIGVVPSPNRPLLTFLLLACACPGPVVVLEGGESSSAESGDPTDGPATSTGGCDPTSPAEGEAWGPCRADRTCDAGLGCEYVVDPAKPQGSICAPLCVGRPPTCPLADLAVDSCGAALGQPACEVTTACALPCEADDDCGPALACRGRRCLWPE